MKTKLKSLLYPSLALLIMILIMAGCNKEDLQFEAKSDLQELKHGKADQNKLLAQIKGATAKYHNFDAALADQYVLDLHCVEVPGLGGMGFHALRMDLIDGVINPLEPEVLVYEPMKNGKLRLVAVEYIVVAELWDAENDGPPMLGNVAFNDHRAPGSGGPPFPHYQLHVWIWKNNPKGIYFPFNPNVNCEYSFYYESPH
jgi:hypothetical protein